MKQCPTCKRSYDETLSFCLDDGTPLVSSPNSETTLVMAPPAPEPMATLTAPVQRTPTSPTVTNAVPPASNARTGPALYIVIALLALLVGGGLVAMLKSNASNNQTNEPQKSVASEPSVTSSAASPQTQSKTITVSGQRMWTDTGIDVKSGELLEINASGRANASGVSTDGAYKWVGPDGWGYAPEFNNSETGEPMRWVYVLGSNSSLMCLTGKVGTNGTPFKVGSNYSFTADQTGRLYLGVNDVISDYKGNVLYRGDETGTIWPDNGGSFIANVKRTFRP